MSMKLSPTYLSMLCRLGILLTWAAAEELRSSCTVRLRHLVEPPPLVVRDAVRADRVGGERRRLRASSSCLADAPSREAGDGEDVAAEALRRAGLLVEHVGRVRPQRGLQRAQPRAVGGDRLQLGRQVEGPPLELRLSEAQRERR